jgi:menaquinol-cytochrome c reductase iron-sulfur subunit
LLGNHLAKPVQDMPCIDICIIESASTFEYSVFMVCANRRMVVAGTGCCAAQVVFMQKREVEFMNRRTVSGLLVVGGSALFAGAVSVPALIAGIAPAIWPRRETWRTIGQVRDFPIGKVSRGIILADGNGWPRSFGEQAVFVWRRSEDEIVVFSRSCTDLGCPLEYDAGSGCFLCPCHGGIFAQDGQRLAGPPKSPMHRYSHRTREGMLEIDISSIPPAA